jgi:uncharacterized membrane protein
VVEIDSQHDPARQHFILSPNSSLTWPQAKQVIVAFAVVELLIGVAFFGAGMTLVLPFSGLEVMVLAAVFYHCLLRGTRREEVCVEPEQVVVRRGRQNIEDERLFARPWLRVELVRGEGWYPSRLTLRSHGQEMEIGDFLTEEERQRLARDLRAAVTG